MDVAKIPGLIADLDSSDPEVKLQAIDGFGEAMQTLAERVVQHLSDPEPWRYFILERLVRLGSFALTPLERLLRESSDRDTRMVAAIRLLGLDSDAGLHSSWMRSVRKSPTSVSRYVYSHGGGSAQRSP